MFSVLFFGDFKDFVGTFLVCCKFVLVFFSFGVVYFCLRVFLFNFGPYYLYVLLGHMLFVQLLKQLFGVLFLQYVFSFCFSGFFLFLHSFWFCTCTS